MRIAFEGYHACKGKMSGVGRYAYNIIKNVLAVDHTNTFEIDRFNFLNRERYPEILPELLRHGNISLKECHYLHYGITARQPWVHYFFSYNTCFRSFADIYHFFGFIIPEKIKGKTIATIHDMSYMLYPETLSKANYAILRKNLVRSGNDADIIVTVSDNGKKEIAEHLNISPDKIYVVYNAVDHTLFFPRKHEEAKKLLHVKYNISGDYLLYLGTLEPRKNIISLIKAYRIFSNRNKDVKLVIAGQKGWKYDEIYNAVNELSLMDRVIFTGYLKDEDIPALYSAAEAFIFPSLYEGFGIPPLEAMACGIPVITSNTSSLPEVMGDAGILTDPRSIEGLAYEMDRLVNDDCLKKDLSKKGIIRAGKFSWQDSAERVLNIYRELSH
jgi:glycosyltransferase involved in cell wall biosynthesis